MLVKMSRIECYVTTDGQSVLMPLTHLWIMTRFLLLLGSYCLFMWSVLSDDRTGL
jgi:hypothetical protein